MGLDMYLSARRYLGLRNGDKELSNELSNRLLPDALRLEGNEFDGIRVKEIIVSAAYWRKANQIHKWFVDNCQEGNDNCGDYYVGRDQLQELVDLCKQVKEDHDKAEELLPVQEGFFFGSTDYDDGYFQDIDYTIERLTVLLETDGLDEYEFYYHSSW